MSDLPEPVNLDAEPAPGFHDPRGSDRHLEKWRAQVDLRLETLARAMTRGKLRTPAQFRRIGEKLGVKPEIVKLWVTDPQVIKKAAVYATALALPSQAERAKEDIVAFKTIAAIGGLVESGPRIQTNVAIDNRNRGDTTSDRKFFEQYQKRTEKIREVIPE